MQDTIAGTRLTLAALAAISLVTLSGCGADDQAAEGSAAQQRAESMAAGQVLFEQTCATCHPRSGRGNYLKRIPATVLTRRSELELMAWIRGSDKHRDMPNFDNLSEAQRRDLAVYLRAQIGK